MKKTLSMIFLLSMMLTQTTWADQCAWITNDNRYIIKSASKLLDEGSEFITYCPKCSGDNKPSNIQKVTDSYIEFPKIKDVRFDGSNGNQKFFQIKITNSQNVTKEIDLAYIYVRTGSRVFANVAMLSGCPVHDVPPFLDTAPGTSEKKIITFEELMSGVRAPSSTKK